MVFNTFFWVGEKLLDEKGQINYTDKNLFKKIFNKTKKLSQENHTLETAYLFLKTVQSLLFYNNFT